MNGMNIKAFEDERAAQARRGSLLEDDASWEKRRGWINEAWAKHDVGGVLVHLGNTYRLPFVCDNMHALKKLGVYEEELLDAYSGTRTNFSNWQPSVLKLLFNIADRGRLLSAGDPLPAAGPFTVYRGVAGRGAKRRLRGISWTASLDQAIWFAKRYAEFPDIEKPMVYQTTVEIEQVYAYDNRRDEQEFLCDIPQDMKLKQVWSDKEKTA